MAEGTCARRVIVGEGRGGKSQKKVLVNTLPSVISAPPALRAQVRVTMLVCVFTLLILRLGEPACVRREKIAQEDPQGI